MTQQEIIAQLELVCGLAPPALQSTCRAFVAREVPAIIAWIIANEDPEKACTDLGICSSFEKVPLQQNKPLHNQRAKPKFV